MYLRLVEGDLLDQDVEVIVNAWNRNLIPWWLLIRKGCPGHQAAGRQRAIPSGRPQRGDPAGRGG